MQRSASTFRRAVAWAQVILLVIVSTLGYGLHGLPGCGHGSADRVAVDEVDHHHHGRPDSTCHAADGHRHDCNTTTGDDSTCCSAQCSICKLLAQCQTATAAIQWDRSEAATAQVIATETRYCPALLLLYQARAPPTA